MGDERKNELESTRGRLELIQKGNTERVRGFGGGSGRRVRVGGDRSKKRE